MADLEHALASAREVLALFGADVLQKNIWGSPMGDANLHHHRRCPLVVFGGANGRLNGGVHVRAPDGTPMANPMLTLLNKLGHDMESFGDSSGELAL